MRQRAVLKRTLDVLGDASFSLTFVQLSPLVIVPFDMVSAPPPLSNGGTRYLVTDL